MRSLMDSEKVVFSKTLNIDSDGAEVDLEDLDGSIIRLRINVTPQRQSLETMKMSLKTKIGVIEAMKMGLKAKIGAIMGRDCHLSPCFDLQEK